MREGKKKEKKTKNPKKILTCSETWVFSHEKKNLNKKKKKR